MKTGHILILTLAGALACAGTAAAANDGGDDPAAAGIPAKPVTHGSLLNMGIPAAVEVLVVGCQGWPAAAHVVLVGKEEAEEAGDGVYRFEGVEAGEYRLYIFGDAGTVSDSTLTISPAAATVRCEVMLDMCIETEMTRLTGVVTRPNGKAAAGARVAVEDLFLETSADKKGRYELLVPPGDWEINASAGGGEATAARINIAKPEEITEGGPPEKTYNLALTPRP